MNQKRNLPVPGEFYRHFKNKIYQIIAIAYHSETGEPMVVYQALYGEYKIWVRPLSMFMEEADHEKYPQATQKYRFERIRMNPNDQNGNDGNGYFKGCADMGESTGTEPDRTEGLDASHPVNPYLLEFFDAMDEKNYDKMLEALAKLAPKATQKEIGDICMVLDMQTSYGDIRVQAAEIRRHILRLKKFDGERLR